MEGKVQPMGFAAHASRPAVRPLLVLGYLSQPDPKLAEAAASEKVDACLITPGQGAKSKKALESTIKALGQVPWGLVLQGGEPETVAGLREMGCDFLVVTLDSLASPVLRQEEMSLVLQLGVDLPDALAQATGELPIDAVLVPDSASLSLKQWLLLRRLCQFSGQPLFLPAPQPATKEDLEALWEAGVRGILVDMDKEGAQEYLREMAKTLETVEAAPKKPRERRTALLPAVSGGLAAEEEEEEPE